MKIELKSVLRRELKSRQLSVNGLARECGIPSSVLHGWVQGTLPSAKNLHHIATLSRYLEVPVSVLLFNIEEAHPDRQILYHSEFVDGDAWYRLSVEKLRKSAAK